MRTCPICGKEIKNRIVHNGKVINTQRRTYCFDCSPFGSGNNQLIKGNKSEEEKRIILEKRRSKKTSQQIEIQKKLRKERKEKLIALFGGKCCRCGYDKCVRALEFHHIDKKGKNFNLSQLGYTCSWERLLKEAKKCELTCANCHRELEEELGQGASVVIALD